MSIDGEAELDTLDELEETADVGERAEELSELEFKSVESLSIDDDTGSAAEDDLRWYLACSEADEVEGMFHSSFSSMALSRAEVPETILGALREVSWNEENRPGRWCLDFLEYVEAFDMVQGVL